MKIAIRFVQIFDMNKDTRSLTTTVTNERYLIVIRSRYRNASFHASFEYASA